MSGPASSVKYGFEVARDILLRCLVDSSVGEVPMPGSTYEGMWGRDSAFMALALTALGEHARARFILQRWAECIFGPDTDASDVCIRHKGDVPWDPEGSIEWATDEWVRARHGAFPTNIYSGYTKYRPNVREVYGREPDVDAATLWIYALGEVCAPAGGGDAHGELLVRVLPALDASLAYLQGRQREDGLIPQGPNEDWADVLRRAGIVTYTQATLYAALRAAVRLYSSLGDEQRAAALALNAERVRRAINNLLLRLDGTYATHDGADEPGGACQDLALLALFGIAPDPKAVLAALDVLDTPHGHRLIEKPYPPELQGPYTYDWGTYHNGGIWPWWLGVEALARARSGDRTGAESCIHHAVKAGTVYEWIDPHTGAGTHGAFVTGAAAIVWACVAGRLLEP